MSQSTFNLYYRIQCLIKPRTGDPLDIYWEIRHFEMTNLSVNGLYQIKLKGKGHFDWAEGKELLVKGHLGLIKLCLQNQDWYWLGDVSEYSISAYDEVSDMCDFTLWLDSPLKRMDVLKRNDSYCDMSIKKLFRTLFERYRILDFRFEFEDFSHPFELQYQQTDYEVLNQLMIQYGLVLNYKWEHGRVCMVISDTFKKGNHFYVNQRRQHGMVIESRDVYALNYGQTLLPKSVRIRAEGDDNESRQYHAHTGRGKFNPVYGHDLFDPYLYTDEQQCIRTANLIEKQFQFLKSYIEFSVPLDHYDIGDVIEFETAIYPQLKGRQFQIIALNKYFTEPDDIGYCTTPIISYQRIIAAPVEQPYVPLHYSLKSYCQRYPMPDSQPYQRFFKPAKPPLMLAVIDGEPNLPQLSYSGKYQVRLDISNEKSSLPLRMAKPYGGKNDAGTFGLEFPLYGGTKVLVSIVNDCSQKLVILGALYKTNQPSVVNNKNQSQYAMQTVGGQGFLLDDATYGIYLFNPKDSQYFAMTGEGEAADITLATKTGSVHLFSKEGLKMVAGSDLKMAAETIQHHVKGNQQTQATNVQLNAKEKISTVAENIFQESESLDIKTDDISFNSQDELIHQATESINIDCQEFNINADKDIIIRAQEQLSFNIGDTHIQMLKDGTIITNKAPTIDAAVIDKHQQSLYQSGTATDFSQMQSISHEAEQPITELPLHTVEKTLPIDVDNEESEQ